MRRNRSRKDASGKRLLRSTGTAIRAQMFRGHPGIIGTASALGLSVRTLQRKLDGKGFSYTRLVEQVRFKEARRLLEEKDFRLADIATDLGYADASSFTRAFQRWTGLAPKTFRSRERSVLRVNRDPTPRGR